MTQTKSGYPNATDAQSPTGDLHGGPAVCDSRAMTSLLTTSFPMDNPTSATAISSLALTTFYYAVQSMAVQSMALACLHFAPVDARLR